MGHVTAIMLAGTDFTRCQLAAAPPRSARTTVDRDRYRDQTHRMTPRRSFGLLADLADTRWTGRPDYTIRSMVGVALAKSIYTLPTRTRTVRLVAEHVALREAIGGETPSVSPATGSP